MYGKNPFCLRLLLSDRYKVKLLYFITEITFLDVRHTSVSYFASLCHHVNGLVRLTPACDCRLKTV